MGSCFDLHELVNAQKIVNTVIVVWRKIEKDIIYIFGLFYKGYFEATRKYDLLTYIPDIDLIGPNDNIT